jgi:hypothetical protein
MIDLGAKCHIDVPKTKELLSRLERKKPALDRFSLVT